MVEQKVSRSLPETHTKYLWLVLVLKLKSNERPYEGKLQQTKKENLFENMSKLDPMYLSPLSGWLYQFSGASVSLLYLCCCLLSVSQNPFQGKFFRSRNGREY